MRPLAPIALTGLIITVPLATLFLSHVGDCTGPGPCVVPVAPGMYAPSGVLVIGAALVLRDAVHEFYGKWATAFAILCGTIVALALGDTRLALAGAAAFLISEMWDLIAYDILRDRSRPLAVLVSGLVGATMDSGIFLFVAFGSFEFLVGQVVAKVAISALVAAGMIILTYRQRAA